MCNAQQIIVCPFVLFLLTIVSSVLLPLTNSDYPSGIFKLFFVMVNHGKDLPLLSIVSSRVSPHCTIINKKYKIANHPDKTFVLLTVMNLFDIMINIKDKIIRLVIRVHGKCKGHL